MNNYPIAIESYWSTVQICIFVGFLVALIIPVFFVAYKNTNEKICLYISIAIGIISLSFLYAALQIHSSPNYDAQWVDGHSEIHKSDVAKELNKHYDINVNASDFYSEYEDNGAYSGGVVRWKVTVQDSKGKDQVYLVHVKNHNYSDFPGDIFSLPKLSMNVMSQAETYIPPKR